MQDSILGKDYVPVILDSEGNLATFVHPSWMEVTEASSLLKEETLAFWHAAHFQQTVGKICDKHDNDPRYITLDDLNGHGKELYNYIQEKIEKEEWKGVIENPRFIMDRSGYWKNDTNLPGYEKAVKMGIISKEDVCSSLCSWNNLFCQGYLDGTEIGTATTVLYTDEWVYTLDGNLFKLSY